MRKLVGPLLGILVLAGVGVAIYFSASEEALNRATVEVNGLIGSEKRSFFDDPRVKQRLKKLGIIANYRKAGSRQIAVHPELRNQDYAFPAGLPAAEKIRREIANTRSYSPFFSPMAIASWKPIAELLVANGVAEKKSDHYTLNMQKYLELFKQSTRWKDLKDNKVFPVNKSFLINSTDIRKSNSAAMYLAIASYTLNQNNVVQNEQQMQAVLPVATELFKRQGFVENSSAAPFEDYLVMGMGKAPMVMMYEQQFIYKASLADGSMTPDMVLIYPEPTLFTKHTLVALTDNGKRLGEALETDPELQQLAIEHGLRNSNVAYFREFIKKHNLPVADNLVNVIDPPSYNIIEGMIKQIEATY